MLFNAVHRGTKKLRNKQNQKNWRPIVQAIAVDNANNDTWQQMVSFAQQISEFGGFVEFHLLSKNDKNTVKNYDIPLLHRIHQYSKKTSDLAMQIVRHSSLVLEPNTLLLQANDELDILQTLRLAYNKSWHSILYRPSENEKKQWQQTQ